MKIYYKGSLEGAASDMVALAKLYQAEIVFRLGEEEVFALPGDPVILILAALHEPAELQGI